MKHRSRRILIGFGVTVFLGALYTWFFGLQTIMMLESRWMARKTPVVRLTPRPLLDNSISAPVGTRLSYFGYEFELPWDDLDQSKTKCYGRRVALHFHSGKTILFMSGPPLEFVNTFFDNKDPATLRQLYGDAPLQSDYALWRFILEATPDKVTLLTPRKETIGIPLLLIMKAVAVPEDSGIYSVQTKNFQGFQYGNPQGQPRHVVADLFADDRSLEFIFSGPSQGHPLAISQADINRVVQTVRKTEEKSTASDLRARALLTK